MVYRCQCVSPRPSPWISGIVWFLSRGLTRAFRTVFSVQSSAGTRIRAEAGFRARNLDQPFSVTRETRSVRWCEDTSSRVVLGDGESEPMELALRVVLVWPVPIRVCRAVVLDAFVEPPVVRD